MPESYICLGAAGGVTWSPRGPRPTDVAAPDVCTLLSDPNLLSLNAGMRCNKREKRVDRGISIWPVYTYSISSRHLRRTRIVIRGHVRRSAPAVSRRQNSRVLSPLSGPIRSRICIQRFELNRLRNMATESLHNTLITQCVCDPAQLSDTTMPNITGVVPQQRRFSGVN